MNRCGINEEWIEQDQECVCISGHARFDGACRPCPANSVPNADKTSCICNSPLQIFIVNRRLCEQCPANSSPNADQSACVCNADYREENGACVLDICPENAVWNQRRLICECTIPGEYLIGRRCRACRENEVWDGDRCVCNEGFYKIFGVCRTCDPHSFYNGSDCECNHGYYGNRDLC